ncbi:MAG TPA: PAS domain-containing protein, partial [Acidobacteriota bacterium]
MSKPMEKTDGPLSSRGPVRILIVEDTAADAELILATLKRAGYRMSFDVVDSPERFQQKLQQADYDLVLSDHNLTTWTGMDALEMLRQSGKDIPFVVSTGTLGDEAAVEYIKRGAADYVLKHRLDRLPIAVGHALRDKAHRDEEARFHEQMLSAKRNWELTFDSVPDPVLLLDAERLVLRANRAATEVFGLKFPVLLGKHCYELLSCPGETREDCPHKRLLQDGQPVRADIEEERLGKIFDMTCSPLRDPQGQMSGCVVVLSDITDRRRAEAQIRLQAAALESAANAILIADREGQITWINPAFTRLTGYTAEEVVGQNPRLLKSGTQRRDLYEQMWKTILAGEVWHGEMTNR